MRGVTKSSSKTNRLRTTKLHLFENTKYSVNKTIIIPVDNTDEIQVILRGDPTIKDLKAFEVIYKTEHRGKMISIRRHCWLPNHNFFHTHVRTGIGRRKFITIYPPQELKNKKIGIKRALNWAKKDILNNWLYYRHHFEKMIKY